MCYTPPIGVISILYLYYVEKSDFMATKSFTEDYSFNVKSANALINALNNNKSPKKQVVANVASIKDKNKIKEIFFGEK